MAGSLDAPFCLEVIVVNSQHSKPINKQNFEMSTIIYTILIIEDGDSDSQLAPE